jgi:hypothetical protein
MSRTVVAICCRARAACAGEMTGAQADTGYSNEIFACVRTTKLICQDSSERATTGQHLTHLRTRVTDVVCGDVSPSNGAPASVGIAIASSAMKSYSIIGISRSTPSPNPHGGTVTGVATTAPAKASAAAAVRSAFWHEESGGAVKELAWVHTSLVVSADDPPPCVHADQMGAVSWRTDGTGAMCVAVRNTPCSLSPGESPTHTYAGAYVCELQAVHEGCTGGTTGLVVSRSLVYRCTGALYTSTAVVVSNRP